MSTQVSRREFIKNSSSAVVLGTVVLTGADKTFAQTNQSSDKGTVIDLTLCDGCSAKDTPACVLACRTKNQDKFPKVDKEQLTPYWPQKTYEDWSDKQDITNRLTPYNWTFVDKVEVEHNGATEEVFVPKRCLHCDNPTCAGVCPFSAIKKDENGAVVINDNQCMGGAKCRDVCPWEIPQRQAGVGLYMKLAPEYLGGGVMYKCDLCADLLKEGKEPACVTACPKGAISFGTKQSIRELAYSRAKEVAGFVYGDKENGGTSTFYVSKVPFEKIDKAIKKQKQETNDLKPGRPTMEVGIENKLDSFSGMAISAAIAPIAGIAAAGFAAYNKLKGGKKNHEEE